MNAITQDQGQIQAPNRNASAVWLAPVAQLLLGVIPLTCGPTRLNEPTRQQPTPSVA